MSDLGGGEQARDASEYVESSVPPEEIKDSTEDRLLELLKPHNVPAHKIRAITLLVNEDTDEGKWTVAQRREVARILVDFLEKLHPATWSLMDWWACQFAIRSSHCESKTKTDVSKALGISLQRFILCVQKWERIFHVIPNHDAQRESVRLEWRHRERCLKKHQKPLPHALVK